MIEWRPCPLRGCQGKMFRSSITQPQNAVAMWSDWAHLGGCSVALPYIAVWSWSVGAGYIGPLMRTPPIVHTQPWRAR